MGDEEFEGVSTAINEDIGWFVWDDGYCEYCGKDFQGEGSYCSTECEVKYRDALKKPCLVCNGKMDFNTGVRHHISYHPEKIVVVHMGCHNRIHKTNLYPQLRPNTEEIEVFDEKNKQSNLYANP